ncbi:MAG: hypothetical protein J1F35_03400 [Erysipelotrichales bacterium]|nr:hypothetical protein [Erysipelotrichales bacterium]
MSIEELKKALHETTYISYNVIDSLLAGFDDSVSNEDKERLYTHIAWHIPTGGPKFPKDKKGIEYKKEILEAIREIYGLSKLED